MKRGSRANMAESVFGALRSRDVGPTIGKRGCIAGRKRQTARKRREVESAARATRGRGADLQYAPVTMVR